MFQEVLRAPGSGCVPPAATLGCKQEGFAQPGVAVSDSWPLWQFRRGMTGVTQSGESRTRLQRNSGYCFRKWAFMTRTGTRQLSTTPAPGQPAQPAWRSSQSQAQLHRPPPRGEGLTNSGGGGCQGTGLDPAAGGGKVQPPQSNQKRGQASTPGRYTHTHTYTCATHMYTHGWPHRSALRDAQTVPTASSCSPPWGPYVYTRMYIHSIGAHGRCWSLQQLGSDTHPSKPCPNSSGCTHPAHMHVQGTQSPERGRGGAAL